MSPRYEIEPTQYGVLMAVTGFASPDDIAAMDRDLARVVRRLPEGFGIVLDMRASPAFSVAAAERLKGQLEVCRRHGMERGAIVLQSAIIALQARRITSEAGLLPRIRFLDASGDTGWERAAVAWVESGEEPDERRGEEA